MIAIAAGVGVGKEGRACAPANFYQDVFEKKEKKNKTMYVYRQGTLLHRN